MPSIWAPEGREGKKRVCPIPGCPAVFDEYAKLTDHILDRHPDPVPQWDPEDFDPGGEHGGVSD